MMHFLCWRPSSHGVRAHCGIPRNEAVDRLAKESAKRMQIEEDLSYLEKKTIKSNFRKSPEDDDYHALTRDKQVVLLRLRTGHNRLNFHMCRMLKLASSAACNCQQGNQTTKPKAMHPLGKHMDRCHPTSNKTVWREAGTGENC